MDRIVKWTNRVGLFSIIILIYWVFTSIAISVFGFKVFRENITEAFFLSIFGIIAVLFGCLIVNIMFNLSDIAQTLRTRRGFERKQVSTRFFMIAFFCLAMVFPILFGGLYLGDRATKKQKETHIVMSAKDMIDDYGDIVAKLSDYEFSLEYIKSTSDALKLISSVDEAFPAVKVIVSDTVNAQNVPLIFGKYCCPKEDKINRVDYILPTSSEEREYLRSVFQGNNTDYRYSSHDGRYELYYPVKTDSGLIVLYLSQYNRYGKIGSS